MRKSLTLLIFIASQPAWSDGVPPVRQGVDIFNSAGGNTRLIAFMKIGATQKDLRYLSFLNAKIDHFPQARAMLAGQLIYFKGLAEPLKVIDLRQRLFSYNGKRLDLRVQLSVEQRMAALEKMVFPRRSNFSIWDWFFPFAYAATSDPAELSALTGVLAVSGVTAGAQCLNESENVECSRQFMGTLAAIGAVGGLRGQDPAASVFCSPDFRGGQRFVIASANKSLLSISESNGEFDIRPSHVHSGSKSSDHAARELLSSCRVPGTLATMNVALAYPASVRPALPVRLMAVRPAVTRTPAALPPRADQEERGGTAR